MALALGVTGAVLGLLLLTGRKTPGQIGGIVLTGGLAVVLLLNRGESWWFALLLLGTMFVGTTVYRWYVGQGSFGQMVGVAVGAVLAGLIGTYVNVEDKIDPTVANAHHTWRPEFTTYTAALLTFALALALRRHAFPKVLTYLGAISYSVYLVHVVVIRSVPHLGSRPVTLVVWVAAVVGVAAVTYRWVERPFHELGRSWSNKVGRPRAGSIAA